MRMRQDHTQVGHFRVYAPSLTHGYLDKLEQLGMDRHSSFLRQRYTITNLDSVIEIVSKLTLSTLTLNYSACASLH